jgi:hypothetical protein
MHHDDGTHGCGSRHRRPGPAAGHAEAPPLTEREKLIVRLDHALRHHGEHAAAFRGMAEEAARVGAAEAAELLRGVAEETAGQAQALEKALAAVRRG